MLILVLNPIPAMADVATLEGFATFTYPTTVKLKKSGCQEIRVKYVTDENLPRENSVMIVAITPTNSRRAYGYAAWLSTLTYMGENALPPMARIGSLPIKVCRKEWLYSPKAENLTPAINPGTFRIVFGGSFYDPITGEMSTEKVEIYRKIKLIK